MSKQRRWANRIVGYGEENPDQLAANPLNWRLHPAAQQQALEGGLDELGWIQSVTVNRRTGYVVDGHARVALALRAGEPTVPIAYIDLSPEEERLALLTLDPIGAMAAQDHDQVAALLELGTAAESAALQAVIDALAEAAHITEEPAEGLTDPDAVPAPARTTTTRLGDAWRLGSHRLLVGDATDPEDLGRLMDGAEADLLLTDPPYGVAYVGKTAEALTIQGDDEDAGATRDLVATALRLAPLRAGGAFYVFSPAGATETAFRLAIQDAGHELRQCLVWVKQQFVMGRQDYHWRHESILYGWRDGAAHYFVPDRTLDTVIDDDLDVDHMSKADLQQLVRTLLDDPHTTVLREDRPHRSELHPTMKPAALVRRLMQNSSRAGDLVLDPFGGSGTTLIAAEQTGRRCCMLELDPIYADVVVKRWSDFTGEEPEPLPREDR